MDTYTGVVESIEVWHFEMCAHMNVSGIITCTSGAVCVHACEHAQVCTNMEGVFRTGVSEHTFGCQGAVLVSACAGAVWGRGCGHAL